MKRRNFIGGLLALPFVGKLLAKESGLFAPPVEEVVDCLECYSNMDCPPGTVCRTVNGVSRCEPLEKCDCECDPEPGRCVPAADGYIEFCVPMTRMNWEMQVTSDGWHYKRIKFVNKDKYNKTGKMIRKIKRSHR